MEAIQTLDDRVGSSLVVVAFLGLRQIRVEEACLVHFEERLVCWIVRFVVVGHLRLEVSRVEEVQEEACEHRVELDEDRLEHRCE